MDKQKSFSVKPIKFLVPSVTISFSIIFVIFFFTWVIKSTPSIHLGTRDFGVKGPSNSSSDYVLKNSILMGVNSHGDENSSSQAAAHVALAEGVQRRESDVAENKGSLIPSGNNLVVDAVGVSDSTKSALGIVSLKNLDGEEAQELNNVVEKGNVVVTENYTGEREVITSDVRQHSSIRNSVDNFNVSDSTKSAVGVMGITNLDGEEDQELNDLVEKGNVAMMDNFTVEREFITSDVRQHSSIQSSVEDKGKVDCDVTRGRWVFDESYPLYTNATCPFIDEGFDCDGNGRLDKYYMKWRWQPQDCDFPRFNATNMLELLRGKRLVFVGDSLNRNQWESMLCLLMGGVKDPKKVYEARGRKITKERGNYCFKFEDYKCTVEYYVSHYLVHESKARIGKKRGQTLRIDTMDKGSSRWREADILVFNTAHWWNHHKTKAGINYYQVGDEVLPRLDVTEAFQRALLTWASWADKNINPHKTHVFFRSSAPAHFSGGQWNTGGHCGEAFRPINETAFVSQYPEKNLVMEEVLRKMKTPVTYLNITRLSDYRPDAHPSIYGRRSINPSVQDCSHWCLPGVPDTWNEVLYYYLQSRTNAIF